jgi:hypothetical protein
MTLQSALRSPHTPRTECAFGAPVALNAPNELKEHSAQFGAFGAVQTH